MSHNVSRNVVVSPKQAVCPYWTSISLHIMLLWILVQYYLFASITVSIELQKNNQANLKWQCHMFPILWLNSGQDSISNTGCLHWTDRQFSKWGRCSRHRMVSILSQNILIIWIRSILSGWSGNSEWALDFLQWKPIFTYFWTNFWSTLCMEGRNSNYSPRRFRKRMYFLCPSLFCSNAYRNLCHIIWMWAHQKYNG